MIIPPLIIWICVSIASLVLITKSAGYAINAILDYAKKTGLSHYFIGLLAVSIGTTLPEITTAILASLQGSGGLILGDALGATIVDVTLVLGFTAIIGRKIKIKKESVDIKHFKILPVLILPLILGIDGKFTRLDGILMIIMFLIYYGHAVYKESKNQRMKQNVPMKKIWKDFVIFSFNIAILIFGAQLLVTSSQAIVNIINIPIYIFGAIIVSIFTSSPEFIVEYHAVKNKKAPLALGDIFGSVVSNVSLVLGIAAIISPLAISTGFLLFTMIFMLVVVTLAIYFIRDGELNWKEGLVLMMLYLIFVTVQIKYFI